MPLFDLTAAGLSPVPQSTFAALGLLEREHIQKAIRHQIAAITPGVKTMVLAEEFSSWVDSTRRIDLLCLDSEARLVIVELKRDHSSHMELQALRYAAMVSTMRFEQAIEAHRKYLRVIGSAADAEQSIRDFLEVDDGPIALSEKVRIVLAASDFNSELTTAVLWLNKQGLDLRCVQMRPHSVGERVLLDIQQLIPLPAAEQYQVALREKEQEQASVQRKPRDTTRYDLMIGETILSNLPKRRLVFEIFSEALRRGLPLDRIARAVPDRGMSMFKEAPVDADDAMRFYVEPADLRRVGDRTYAFTSQWGGAQSIEAARSIIDILPGQPSVDFAASGAVVSSAIYGEYAVKQHDNLTIEVTRNDAPCPNTIEALRTLASELRVSLTNSKGGVHNTRTLGAHVIRAIANLEE